MRNVLLSVAVVSLGLALAEIDWLVKTNQVQYASKNGRTALLMDPEQIEYVIKEKRESERRWR